MVKRQAVVLIHGIGEQKPMDTIRRFVNAVWTSDTESQNRFAMENAGALFWSKPDMVSNSFELRRLTTPRNKSGITTDFYEFYWQHLMQGTTFGHVGAWAKTLLLRHPSAVPRQLLATYILIWLVIAFGLALAAYAAAAGLVDAPQLLPAWLSALVSIALVPALGLAVRNVIGDAARYLHVAPTNVQSRHEIRQAGVNLLKALHEPTRGYDRIVLVGHSLGTVIGFDILTHAWPAYNDTAPTAAVPSNEALDALEQLAGEVPPPDPLTIDVAQRAYLNELKANGNGWRVTDFVTLGSPLAHAAILLADDEGELRRKQTEREFPTCLPTPETLKRAGRVVKRFSYELKSGANVGYRVPHHAAMFGPTCWTNLYFPNRKIVVGDLVGGPLRSVFGSAIRDVAVTTTERHGLLSHTLYWSMPKVTPKRAEGANKESKAVPPHIVALRQALNLMNVRGPSSAIDQQLKPDAESEASD